jgi:hypothetical protein
VVRSEATDLFDSARDALEQALAWKAGPAEGAGEVAKR